MPRTRFALLILILALLPLTALAAETITFQKTVKVKTDVEYVDLGETKAKSLDELIVFLKKLPNLKKVDMFATTVNASQIKKLEKNLPNVEFGWTMSIKCRNPRHPERNTHLIRTDATAFSTLHNNQCMEHTSADFEILKYCKNLLALDIGHNRVDDLSFLQYLPKLRVLIIGRNNIIKDLSPIANCPDLEYLEAFSNQIASVKPLLSCPHLMDLNITNNPVQDPELYAQMTSLKRLWVYQSTAKGKDIAALKSTLKKALPNCTIDWNQMGTNGWREPNKHYKVISEMFNTGVYIPFADSYE